MTPAIHLEENIRLNLLSIQPGKGIEPFPFQVAHRLGFTWFH
jgi:hypothetical protein